MNPASENSKTHVQWGNNLEFLMSCIAMSVGLGNIWRFPFVAYENGGGAFLIPYLIVLTIIGRPMYYLEMYLGQFSSHGNDQMYLRLAPYLRFIGIGQLIGTVCVASYYASLMAITLFYLITSLMSINATLPWTECSEEWTDYLAKINRICIDSHRNPVGSNLSTISSSEMFFKREVLHEIDDITSGMGSPDWLLTIYLFVAWLTTFIVSIKGVKSSGKASYFLAIFPYIIMITLLIRASTLEGADKGMYAFIKFDWAKLMKAEVWYAAVTQCFFSLNVGFGAIVMYSSYNDFRHNINRDALVVTTLDTFTSLLSGATTFGILGNLAHELGVDVEDVVGSGGTGLAFISYPEALAKFQAVPWLFAILFFLMLFILGVGSLVALQNSMIIAVKEAFPNIKTWMVSFSTAFLCFCIGLLYVTPGGQYIIDLMDHYGGTFTIFMFGIMEVIAICWLYGVDNICMDFEFMLKSKPHLYWRIMWRYLMPVLLVSIFIYFLATLQPLTYGLFHLEFPTSILAIGYLIIAIDLGQIFIWICYYLVKNTRLTGNICSGIKNTFQMGVNWRPLQENIYQEWVKFRKNQTKH